MPIVQEIGAEIPLLYLSGSLSGDKDLVFWTLPKPVHSIAKTAGTIENSC